MRLLSSSREDLLVLLTSSYSQASQVALAVKNPPANAGDLRVVGSIPDSGRSPGGGHSTPLQCTCLENPLDRGAWRAVAHRVTKRLKWLSTAVIMRISHFNTMRNGAESGPGTPLLVRGSQLVVPTESPASLFFNGHQMPKFWPLSHRRFPETLQFLGCVAIAWKLVND